MTAVTIRGTFKKDEREGNGLEPLAGQLLRNRTRRYIVVGVVEFAGGRIPGPADPVVPAVRFVGIEPLFDDDARTARDLFDQARKARELNPIAATLFDEAPPDGNKPAGWVDEQAARREVEGQQALDVDEDAEPADDGEAPGPWPGDPEFRAPDGDQ